MKETKVYVCTPSCSYNNGGDDKKKALESWLELDKHICDKLINLGYMPILPKLYFDMATPIIKRTKLQVDYDQFSQKCLMEADELWIVGQMLTDEMIVDIEVAEFIGIPIRYMVFTSSLDFMELPIGDMSKWKVVGE